MSQRKSGMGYENIDILVESTESFLVKRVLVDRENYTSVEFGIVMG